MIPPKGQIRRASRALQAAGGRLRRFCHHDEGNVTVELVLWVPVLCAILMLFVDTSLAYMSQSNFWNISRETARIVSRHAFDASAAEAYARSRLDLGTYHPDVQVSINGQAVTVTISALSSAVTPFGILDFALDQRISASVTNVMEPI
jgi:Flp pilus assembly protein TadG